MIGKTLGHYSIVARLGEGGMGVVYKALDTRLNRPVALKVLPPELMADEERRLRFQREARAAASVNHPNIATIYDVGEADGTVFIAMEYVQGTTLASLIGGRPLQVPEAVRIALEVAEGLGRAHENHVIHRDLKPENIIVGADGHAKILDFGLAKLLEERDAATDPGASRLETISRQMTLGGKVMGTIAYMSPEQARGETVDARSDLFSFGVTLYEMVTGLVPFQGRTSLDTLTAITQKEAASPGALNPELPAVFEQIIAKCLRKDPRQRYQHTDEVVVDLRELKRVTDSGAAVAAAPRTGARRRVAIVGVGAIAALGAVAILVALNVGGWRDRLLGRAVGGGPAPARIESLAVLPLVNLSGDPQQEYFADGMTEELIADLAKISALRVISRTSVMQFKGTRKALPEIGRALNVDAVIEGSVLRSGERVRITAQLVEAATDRHLWAESYERDLRDVLTLQTEVARAIAREIEVKVTPQEQARLAIARPVDPAAHEAYLKGRYYSSKRTEANLVKGIGFFRQAIERDPANALAYCGLADSYNLLAAWYYRAPKEALPEARTAALKALEIDDSLAEAHASLGWVEINSWNWAEGERELRRSMELNPGDATGPYLYANYLIVMGRAEEATDQAKRARELDPLSPATNALVATSYYFARQYDQAMEEARKAIEIEPGFFWSHTTLGQGLVRKGRYAEGISELQKSVALSGGGPDSLSFLGYAYALAGKRQEALKTLAEIRAVKRPFVAAIPQAIVFTGLGDRDQAFAALEKAYEQREPDMRWLKGWPDFDPLRSDPRFQDLMRRMAFPQ